MRLPLLIFGIICTAIVSSNAQVIPSLLWDFNLLSDAVSHNSQSWKVNGFNLYDIDIVYNAKGKPTSFTASTPPPMRDQTEKYMCTYRLTGNNLVEVTQEQEAGETTWTDMTRTTFVSDGMNDTLVLDETYNTITSLWENDNRVVIGYNGSNISEMSRYFWQVNTWVLQQKEAFMYAAGNVDSVISYRPVNGILEKSGYRKYFRSAQLDSVLEYAIETRGIEFSNRIVVNSSVNGKTASFTMYNWDNNAWQPSLCVTYGSGSSAGFSALNKDAGILLCPNPATNELTLHMPTVSTGAVVTILDIHGKIVLSQTLQLLQSPIDIATLHQGVYFVRTESGGSTSTQKLIKH